MDFSDPTVQVGLVGLVGVILAALFGLGGVWIGGRISARAARDAATAAADATRDAAQVAKATADADREAVRQQQFSDVVRTLAAQILLAGQTHMDELNVQVNSRIGTQPRSADGVPPVGSTEAMKLSVQELRLTAREPATADAAHRFYATTAWLGGSLVYIAQRDRRPDGNVVLLTDDQFQGFQQRLDRWVKDRNAFVNAVRVELGAEPFPDAGHD